MLHIRKRVPKSLKTIIGSGEIWRSLRTGDAKIAVRRSHRIHAEIESLFDQARLIAELTVEQTIPSPLFNTVLTDHLRSKLNNEAAKALPPLGFAEAYDRFITDPNHAWSRRTRIAHLAARSLAMSIIGPDNQIRAITRAHCRDFVDVLKG